ncbi:RHS repeat-associated core domain-containing protein [Boseongicola sp. H5]|uniref:RHS repeat-associated core domain-containing protein n=1 Tax=Boseongicola sp. H5 TaxID=2763261 RepID=UPI001D0AC5F5
MRRWLHGPEVDEPLAYERYAGTTAGGTGTALELFRNRLGSVILAVSVSTGAVAAEYDYDSFGQRTLVQGTEEVRYGFTSREHDARTGLIHYRARAYDPLTGRFLQRDPIGFASEDFNLYAYAWNNPYVWTDSSGLAASIDNAGLTASQRAAGGGWFSGIASATLGLARNFATALSAAYVVNPSAVGDGTVPPVSPSVDAADEQIPQVTGREVVPYAHGNNLQNPRRQEIYYLLDRTDGSIQKIGLRGEGLRRYSETTLRAQNVRLQVVQTVQGRLIGSAVESAHIAGFFALNGRLPPQQINFGR